MAKTDNTDVALWDRLAGTLYTYIGSFYTNEFSRIHLDQFEGVLFLYAQNNNIIPISENFESIINAENINDLTPELQKAVLWHLPRFFEAWPEYKDAECLKIKE